MTEQPELPPVQGLRGRMGTLANPYIKLRTTEVVLAIGVRVLGSSLLSLQVSEWLIRTTCQAERSLRLCGDGNHRLPAMF